MDKELLKFLVSFLSTTLKMDEAGVAALFEADGSPKADTLKQLLDKDKDRVALLIKGKFDEGHKAAEKKVMTNLEKELKTKFGIDSDKEGVELIEAIVAAKTPKGAEITDEQVKKHKVYLDLKEANKLAIDEATKATKEELDKFKAQVAQKETSTVVKAKALSIFEDLKPVLSTDTAKAAKQKELFVNLFENGQYRIEGERIIMLNPDKTDMVDGHGNRMDFETAVKSKATELYDLAVADPKGSPGAKPPAGGGGGGGSTGKKPKTKDEFVAYMGEAKDDKERAEITQAWQDFQTQGK